MLQRSVTLIRRLLWTRPKESMSLIGVSFMESRGCPLAWWGSVGARPSRSERSPGQVKCVFSRRECDDDGDRPALVRRERAVQYVPDKILPVHVVHALETLRHENDDDPVPGRHPDLGGLERFGQQSPQLFGEVGEASHK